MFTKRVALLLAAFLIGISFCACASVAPPPADTPAPAAAVVAPESVVLALVTPVPTPTLSPSPTPSPEPTGRALRAWNLQQQHRDFLTQHPPANGDIEGTLAAMMIDADKKLIAITFDDGPKGAITESLLDGLAERGVKASFFKT